MDDKEFEEIKKDWTDDRIAYLTMQLLQTRPVSIIQQLIAYCEELREAKCTPLQNIRRNIRS